jgi:hypothetical protein
MDEEVTKLKRQKRTEADAQLIGQSLQRYVPIESGYVKVEDIIDFIQQYGIKAPQRGPRSTSTIIQIQYTPAPVITSYDTIYKATREATENILQDFLLKNLGTIDIDRYAIGRSIVREDLVPLRVSQQDTHTPSLTNLRSALNKLNFFGLTPSGDSVLVLSQTIKNTLAELLSIASAVFLGIHKVGFLMLGSLGVFLVASIITKRFTSGLVYFLKETAGAFTTIAAIVLVLIFAQYALDLLSQSGVITLSKFFMSLMFFYFIALSLRNLSASTSLPSLSYWWEELRKKFYNPPPK